MIGALRPSRLSAGKVGLLLAAMACSTLAAGLARASERGERVKSGTQLLFVGNSIIYTNNLPEVTEAISGGAIQADMFVSPGATLSELIEDKRLERLLASRRYAAVVVQERGGSVLCLYGIRDSASEGCRELESAHLEISGIARSAGTKVVYLGTYQSLPAASSALVVIERQLSERMNARYAQVSERLQALRQIRPELPWLQEDGVHPGMATTALMATAVYVAMTGERPTDGQLCITPSAFRPSREAAVLALHRAPAANAPQECPLDASAMREIGALTLPDAKFASTISEGNANE